MGSSLSPVLANLFVNVFEISVIDELIKKGKILKWCRFVDDCFAIIDKDSEELIFDKLNSWDSKLTFTTEKMSENGLVFLDCLIFYKDKKLHSKKYRKEGINTVVSNYEHSVMCKKYLRNSIFTMLHREKDCSSSQELFLESLEELKEVLRRNNYPQRLVDSKIAEFLKNDQKPDRPPKVHTLCLDYNSANIEAYVNNLIKRMKKLVPSFEVNIAYKTQKVCSIFSNTAKVCLDFDEVTNTIYQFQCPCNSTYVGQSERPLVTRIREHQQPSRSKNLPEKTTGIYKHIDRCPVYQQKRNLFAPVLTKKIKFEFFKTHFKILKKGFRSDFERRKTEAFYIRVKSPDLNDQRDHTFFKLF